MPASCHSRPCHSSLPILPPPPHLQLLYFGGELAELRSGGKFGEPKGSMLPLSSSDLQPVGSAKAPGGGAVQLSAVSSQAYGGGAGANPFAASV